MVSGAVVDAGGRWQQWWVVAVGDRNGGGVGGNRGVGSGGSGGGSGELGSRDIPLKLGMYP